MNTKTLSLVLASLASFSALAADLPQYDCTVQRYTGYSQDASSTTPVVRVSEVTPKVKPVEVAIPNTDETARIAYYNWATGKDGAHPGAANYELCLYVNKTVPAGQPITNISATCVSIESTPPKNVTISDVLLTDTKASYTAICTQ